MKILLSLILILAAICVFVILILINKNRAKTNDMKGITWSNIKRQSDIIDEQSKFVEKAHIDEEYAKKAFEELDKKDKVISILSVAGMFLIVLSIFLLLLGDMSPM